MKKKLPCFPYSKTKILILFLLCNNFLFAQADIVFDFCAVDKDLSTREWGGTLTITNNTNEVLDFGNNSVTMDWPTLVALQFPFNNAVQNATTWEFNIALNFPGTLAPGGVSTVQIQNNSYDGVLQFPTSGTFNQNGTDYTIEVINCNTTRNVELRDVELEFNRNCFIKSPKKLCLGQGATEVRNGEGIKDVMIPTDRPSWAIAVMVAYRMFENLTGQPNMVSPNFWLATGLSQSQWECDPTIVPNTVNHCPINSSPNTCTGIENSTNNCFQLPNISYANFLQNNQPELFGAGNPSGQATFANIVDNGNWETGAMAVTYNHYQNMRYWQQVECFDTWEMATQANDPYAVEKFLYHGYQGGFFIGTTLANDIQNNWANAMAATDMNTVINTNGTWSDLGGTSSQKVANFTYLLDGNVGRIHTNVQVTDFTTDYYGCYNAPIDWNDVIFYLDQMLPLYAHIRDANEEAAIKAVFDGLNGGAAVDFEDLGPVIDEIVIQMGGHDPSLNIATQYGIATNCPNEPLDVALSTNDKICSGEEGEVIVRMSGDPDFEFDLEYPDGSVKTFSNVSSSPFLVPVDQPGSYKIISLEDANEVWSGNCHSASITIPSKSGSTVAWDKTQLLDGCTNEDLVINKTGNQDVTVTYTHDGVVQPTVQISAFESSKTIVSNPQSGKYVITNMTPNSCNTTFNDEIEVCKDEACKPIQYKMVSLIPNHSFEDVSACPDNFGQIDRATDWDDAVDGISYDLVGSCGGAGYTPNNIMADIPGGKAADGDFFVTSYSGWDSRYLLANCLNQTMNAGTQYTFKFKVAHIGTPIRGPANPGVNNPPVDFTLYGSSACLGGPIPLQFDITSGMPVSPCISHPMQEMGTTSYNITPAGSKSSWDEITITFTPNQNINYIVLGTSCTSANADNYNEIGFALDNLILETQDENQASAVSIDSTGALCNNDLTLTASPDDQTVYTYKWFQDGNEINNETNPVLDVSGNNLPVAEYSVLVTNPTENTCSRDTVKVNPSVTPTVDLGSDIEVCQDAYPFDISGPLGMDSYSWTRKTDVGNTDVFAVTDSGKVVLEIDSLGCKAKDSLKVTNFPTIIDFNADETNLCEGEEVVFTNTSTDVNLTTSTCEWDFGDGSTSNDCNNVTHTYANQGDYAVTLKVTDANGCENVINKTNLIDVTDCNAPCKSVQQEVNSLIPNPSFEDVSSCPTSGWNQFNRAIGWQDIINVTAILEGPCGGGGFISNTPPPGGKASDGNLHVTSSIYPLNRYFLGNCLTSPMKSGKQYTFEFDVGPKFVGAGTSPFEFVLYGTPNCQNLPLKWGFNGGMIEHTCNSHPFPVIAKVNYTPSPPGSTSKWDKVSITFTPNQDINFIVLGATCNNLNNDINFDFGLDNLILAESQEFNAKAVSIDSTGALCTNDLILEAQPNDQTIYTYQWFQDGNILNNETTPVLDVSGNSLPAAAYSVLVTNSTAKTCSRDTVIVNPSVSPKVDLGNDIEVCEGAYPFDLTGPTGMDSYTWTRKTDVGNNQDFAVNDSGWVELRVDSMGCENLDSVYVETKPSPVVDLGSDPTTCFTSPPYEFDATTPNASYVWKDGSTNAKFSTDQEDWYWVDVTVDGCTTRDSVYLTVSKALSVDIGPDQTICPGGEAEFKTDLKDVSYNWNNGASTASTFKTSTAGTVALEVTDPDGCRGTVTANVIVDNPLNIDLGNDISFCVGDSALLGLTPPKKGLTYSWNTGATDSVIKVKTGGTYTLSVDSLSCTAQSSVDVLVNPLPTVDLGDDIEVCQEAYPFNLTGPTGMDSYNWTRKTDAGNTDVFAVNDSGKVVLEIDSLGCTSKDSLRVYTKPTPTVDLGNDIEVCEGAYPFDLTGPTGMDSYTWTRKTDVGNNQDFAVNDSGWVELRVDSMGCENLDSVYVKTKPSPVVDLGSDPTTCFTSPPYEFDATTLNASYVWKDGSTNAKFSTDQEDWYWVDVTVDGCTTRDSVYLTVSKALSVDIGPDQTICPGGEAEFKTDLKDVSYNWNNGASTASTFKTSTAGTVALEVTDPDGCRGTVTANVIVDNPLNIDLGNDISFCAGDSALLGLTPPKKGLTYSWNTGATDSVLKVKTGGTYTLSVDSLSCTAQSSVDVLVNPLPTVDLGDDQRLCAGSGQSIQLNAGNFATYLWSKDASGAAATFDAIAEGEYKVTVSDVNGCTQSDSVKVIEQQATPFELEGGKDEITICPGGAATIDVPANILALNNATWEWQDNSNGNSFKVENKNDGDDVLVKLTVSNEFGCVSEDELTVKIRNVLPIDLGDSTVCEGQDITFNSAYPSANYTHEWNNDPTLNQNFYSINDAKVSDGGTIHLDLLSDEGCSRSISVNLTVHPLPKPQLQDASLCEGESLTLNTGATGSHLWNDGSTSNTLSITDAETSDAETSDAETYSVTVTSPNNCSANASMELTVNAKPNVQIIEPQSACEGETVTLSTNLGEGHDYVWTGNETSSTLPVTNDGTYQVRATDIATGCEGTDEITVSFLTAPTVTLPKDSVLCEGTEWYIAPTNSQELSEYDISWSTGESTMGIVVGAAEEYWISVKNTQCEARDTIVVGVNPLPTSMLGNDTTLCFDDIDSYILNPGRADAYEWNDGDNSQVKYITEPGLYTVELSDEHGCSTEDKIEVKEDCPSAIWLPNAFTPNGDGSNDLFKIVGRNIEEVELLLFNRWGELIWEGRNIGDAWDGTYNNIPVQQDVYVYKLKYSYENTSGVKSYHERIGTVTVIK